MIRVKAQQKYIRISPRKIRLVADAIRNLKPNQAIEKLQFIRKTASIPLAKTIKQAVANAVKNANLSEESLRFERISVGAGPTLKRWNAVSRGRAHAIKKRTSHITIILEPEESKTDQKKGLKDGAKS